MGQGGGRKGGRKKWRWEIVCLQVANCIKHKFHILRLDVLSKPQETSPRRRVSCFLSNCWHFFFAFSYSLLAVLAESDLADQGVRDATDTTYMPLHRLAHEELLLKALIGLL